ncbi:hypothetical protein AAE478_004381 [Parahypoxylon ruwenzoriense]
MFDDAKSKRDEIYEGTPHESKLSHELIGGGAAFEAMKLFEDRKRKEGMSYKSSLSALIPPPSLATSIYMFGQPVKHAFAKELLAGIAGAEVDKLFETKGLDFLDREKAKRHAKEQAEKMYDHQYSSSQQYDPLVLPHSHPYDPGSGPGSADDDV